MPILNPKCLKCQSEMILKEKDSQKFWGCPNWKRCGGRTMPYAGVDKKPQEPSVFEAIAELGLKLDWIIEKFQEREKNICKCGNELKIGHSHHCNFIDGIPLHIEEPEKLESLKDILGNQEKEIDVKDIPF